MHQLRVFRDQFLQALHDNFLNFVKLFSLFCVLLTKNSRQLFVLLFLNLRQLPVLVSFPLSKFLLIITERPHHAHIVELN